MVTKTKQKAEKPPAQPAQKGKEALEKLEKELTGTRLSAEGTVRSYSETARRFLNRRKSTDTPDKEDVQDYCIRRRKEGISERTLLKEFSHLLRLYQANGWPWDKGTMRAPQVDEEAETPAMPLEHIQQLIEAREKLSPAERFYLAVATTWLVRRAELALIQKRDYDGVTFLINTKKHGKKQKHLIPDALKPVFDKYRASEHDVSHMSAIFRHICVKAGVPRKPRMGWHSIRRSLETMLEYHLATNRLPLTLLGDYSGWKATKTGSRYSGVAMSGVYRRPELIYDEPFGIDKAVYEVHPFLPFWGQKQKKKSKKV